LAPEHFKIVDVCANRAIFEAFAAEWMATDTFSVALGCVKTSVAAKSNLAIGGRILRKRADEAKASAELGDDSAPAKLAFGHKMAVGVAVSFGSFGDAFVSYYIPLLGANASSQAGEFDG
jgi:hypothetical protein